MIGPKVSRRSVIGSSAIAGAAFSSVTPALAAAAPRMVDAICSVVSSPSERRVSGAFNVADDIAVDLVEVLGWLTTGMGRPLRLVPVPVGLMSRFLSIAGKEALARSLFGDLIVDTSGFRNAYSWSPPVSARDGITKSGIDFMRLHGR